MREIKFRAYTTIGQPKMIHMNLKDCSGEDLIENDKWKVMQYTGLKDSNGNEIYEGDIMKYLPHYPHDYQENHPMQKHGRIAGPVFWEKGWLYSDYHGENHKDSQLLYSENSNNWEIVGNIYENPELLK